jgi:hypothetical protein
MTFPPRSKKSYHIGARIPIITFDGGYEGYEGNIMVKSMKRRLILAAIIAAIIAPWFVLLLPPGPLLILRA